MPRTPAESLRRTAIRTGISVGAVLSVRALFRPLPAARQTRQIVDWERVRRQAHARTGERGPLRDDLERGARYDGFARDLASGIATVVGEEVVNFPRYRSLDRRGFINNNLIISQRVLEPVQEMRNQMPDSRASEMSRVVLSRYMGELFGFLSTRALGQYDPVLRLRPGGDGSETTSLFLVENNLEALEQQFNLDADSLRRWLILHEQTHAWQFEAHPWLLDHLASMIRDLVLSGMTDGDGALVDLPSSREVVSRLPGTVRSQLRGMSRIQAVMSVLEGYADFVMHRTGSAQIKNYETLQKAFAQRRKQRTTVERMVIVVTGMRVKMRQYEVGERWASAVADKAGLDVLNRVWLGPAQMPSLLELREPERWLKRVG